MVEKERDRHPRLSLLLYLESLCPLSSSFSLTHSPTSSLLYLLSPIHTTNTAMSMPTDLDTFEVKLLEHGVCVIAFNRPKRYNALNPQVYDQWGRALEWAAKSDDVRVVVLTGNGKYYTSGQELTIPESSELEEGVEAAYKKRSGYTE